MNFTRWADVYTARARQFKDPLDICEFYSGGKHYGDEWFRYTAESIRSVLDLQPSDRVLEVGCGCGVLMDFLRPHVQSFVGVDLSPGVLEVARQRLPDVPFVEAAADQLPFGDGQFDKCFAYQVIHYLTDFEEARRAIQQMHRVIRPGGRILLGQVPDASKEAAYQDLRRSRSVNRDTSVTHQLRWLWYPEEFFHQWNRDFASVTIQRPEHQDDVASQFRMNVVMEKSEE